MQDAFIGNIDYSDDHDFYDHHSNVPLNFNPNDLLIGDSFENEGNINLMSNDKVDKIEEVAQPHSSEKFNSAFPELYKDLAIFKAPMKKSRKSDIEIRVKKRAHIPNDNETHGALITNANMKATTSTTTLPQIVTEETENVRALFSNLEILNYPTFLNESMDNLDKKYLMKTSTGSVYGTTKLASKGTYFQN